MIRKINIKALLLATVLFAATFVKSQTEPVLDSVLKGSDGKLVQGAQAFVKDIVFFDPVLKPTILFTNKVSNVVTFRIDEYSTRLLPDSFKADAQVRVIFVDKNNQKDSIEKTLTINYNKKKTYTNKSHFYFNNAHEVNVKVLSLSAQYAPLDSILPVLDIENQMIIDRDYKMDCALHSIKEIQPNDDSINVTGELVVSWASTGVAEEYDLEWTYVDSSAIASGRYNTSGQLDAALLFKFNASLVTVASDHYSIPMLYDGDGILYFRVRGAQFLPDGRRVTTPWSSDFIADGGLGEYDFPGHERRLNWQSSTSFAEEGKRKTVVQYFDGSLKGRQTVTKDNTTGTTVVAETLYDKQGRPAIQILPAPTLSSIIQFTPRFNTGLNGAEYDKGVYDTVLTASDYCADGAPAFDSTSGTHQYYSPDNPLKAQGFHQYIPNAYGFAFTETRYSQDNTGRITKQSGVGKEFRIGSGHETKYYDGMPDQDDLDALFGTEAGDRTHYQKNMVRDANGQYSVSYVDMHGRTVATALAGSSPTTLQQLSSYTHNTVTTKLITSTNNTVKGTAIEAVNSIVVTRAGAHSFNYQLNAQSLGLENCNDETVCYDCLYDLEITVTDDCNNQNMPGDTAFRSVTKNFSLNAIDTTCTAAQSFAVNFSLNLSEGAYIITKRLSINQEAMQYYRDSVFLVQNTCKSYEDIVNEQRSIIGQQLGNCSPDTIATKVYENFKQQMLYDLTPPSGQYANLDSMLKGFSIFNREGASRYLYRSSDYSYKDAEGNKAFVEINGALIPPNQLSPGEFIQYFEPSWAEALLKAHPEYELWLEYEKLKNSHIWDEDFEKTDTYTEAVAKGYLNPTTSASSPASRFTSGSDPLFTDLNAGFGTSVSNAAKQSLSDSLFSHKTYNSTTVTAWGLATMMAKCPDALTLDASCVSTWNHNDSVFSNMLCEGELNMAWRFFRGSYLEMKKEWVDKFIRSRHPGINYPGDLGFIPVFPNMQEMLQEAGYGDGYSDPSQHVNTGKAKLAATINASCQDFAERWVEQLGTCNYPADSLNNVIIPRLIEVCKKGGDAAHPYGASTISPDSTLVINGKNFESFDDVIRDYNQSHGITTNANCNGYLIDLPKAHNLPFAIVQKPLYSKPDSCECARINQTYNQYTANTAGYSSYSDFMLKKYKTTISQGTLDTLRNLCNGTITCKFIPQMIQLPPTLQCGTGTACVDCITVKNAYDSFAVRIPGAIPSRAESDTMQIAINKAFTGFMNQRLGMSKTATEYLSFMDSCGYSVSGDSLSYILNQFKTNYQIPSSYTPAGQYNCDTTDWFMSPSTLFSWAESIQNGILTFPARITSNPGQIHYYYNRPLVIPENGLSIETRLKLPLLDTTNCNLPNFQFQLRPQGGSQVGWVNALFRNRSIRCNVTSGAFDLGDSTHPPPSNRIITIHPQMAIEMEDWVKIKAVILPNRYQLYVADTFLLEVPYTGPPLTRLNQFVLFFSTGAIWTKTVPAVDYVRVYDGCNQLVFNQDFDSASAVVCPDLSVRVSPDDFKTAFKNYYNDYKSTSYSTAQVDSIYQAAQIPLLFNCSAGAGSLLCGTPQPYSSPITFTQADACSDSTQLIATTATEIYRVYKDSIINSFNEAYTQKCLAASAIESFTVTKPVSEYHYTLYYYDQAGNLVKTISPEGVKPNRDTTWLAQIRQKRDAGERQVPNHGLATTYRYNSLNQVVTQNSPDGGYSKFWYDRLGRLVVSQNAKQQADTAYSYTKYDSLGRITEVGEKEQPTAMTSTISRDTSALRVWLEHLNGLEQLARQVTRTVYDKPGNLGFGGSGSLAQSFRQKGYTLRNRVSHTLYYDLLLPVSISQPELGAKYGDYNSGTYYAYDIHGNVDTLLQDYMVGIMQQNGANKYKLIAYNYDLISGKVNQVHYQPGEKDQIYHRYEYDAENRITDVYTTDVKDFVGVTNLEEKEAFYQYYKHGPLARTILGQQQVQGIDYAYTLQGWLKGVNSTGLNPEHDMGGDGRAASAQQHVARDVYGFNLNYYNGDFTNDYNSINNKEPFPGHSGLLNGNHRNLFNGNITSMAVNIKFPVEAENVIRGVQLYNYQYDQLDRVVAMDVYRGFSSAANAWSYPIRQTTDYKERVSYDANGNILSYIRNGATIGGKPLSMDSLTYKYFTDVDGNKRNNRLRLVEDDVMETNYTEDIDDQRPLVVNAADSNYLYDQIGNLIRDTAEKINNIKWNVYGKIEEITKTPTTENPVTKISYTYDAAGNRISKKVDKQEAASETTWYVRDASGNVMAVYSNKDSLKLNEHHVYGTSRLGIVSKDILVADPSVTGESNNLLGTTYLHSFERGKKFFELNNHLGNVLATISDKKLQVVGNEGNDSNDSCEAGTGKDTWDVSLRNGEPTYIARTEVNLMPGFDNAVGETYAAYTDATLADCIEYTAPELGSAEWYYAADIINANDYTPFGMQMVGRKWNEEDYRYGFNGKEVDNDVSGQGNQYDYGFRIYNPRLGRFLSVDPLSSEYSMLTPYQFASNRPIDGIDLDGLEYLSSNESKISITFHFMNFEGKMLISGSVYLDQKSVDPKTREFIQAGQESPDEGSIGGTRSTLSVFSNYDAEAVFEKVKKELEPPKEAAAKDMKPESLKQPKLADQPVVDNVGKKAFQKDYSRGKEGRYAKVTKKASGQPRGNVPGGGTPSPSSNLIYNMVKAATYIGEKIVNYKIERDYEMGYAQVDNAKKVVGDIQFGLNTNLFRESDLPNLTEFANYLLDGTMPTIETEITNKDGSKSLVERTDYVKVKRFDSIKAEISKKRISLNKQETCSPCKTD